MMAHPFHIHGNPFYILSINGSAPPANMQGIKDVVMIPPMNGSVRLVTKYSDFSDPDIPYMYHCHILTHEDNGMMGQFLVAPNTTANVDELNFSDIRIFPIPTYGFLTIENKSILKHIEAITIYDVFGRIILKNKIKPIENFKQLDLSELTAGQFFFTCNPVLMFKYLK